MRNITKRSGKKIRKKKNEKKKLQNKHKMKKNKTFFCLPPQHVYKDEGHLLSARVFRVPKRVRTLQKQLWFSSPHKALHMAQSTHII